MDKSEYYRAIEEFCLMDDTFMSAALDRDNKTVALILNIILNRSDLEVIEVIAQRSYNNLLDRSIRLDIFAKDSSGKAYNIEVQRNYEGANIRRARYNSSMMDTRLLSKGQKFSELADSYVIFITESDILGAGLPLYEIDRIVKQTGTYFGDGSHIIYVNGAYEDDSALGKLMHDFKCKNAEEMNYSQIADRVRYIKETEGGRENMCKIMEDLNRKAAKEAANEKQKKIAISMIEKGKLSYEEISEYTGLTVDEVKTLAEGEPA